MNLKRTLLASGLGTMALLATAAAAFAAPAYATGNVNVRSGPGLGYGVVDTLVRGEQVDVQECRGSWCYVAKPGPDGWVSANYLGRASNNWDDDWDDGWNRPPPRPPHWNPYPQPAPRPPYWGPRPQPVYPVYPSNPSSNVCVNGPNGYFCIGN